MILIVAPNMVNAQTISTAGNKILDPCGQEIVLRGVNYAPFNWGYSPGSLSISEIEKTGANCVRLVWYSDSDPTSNLVYQDTAKLNEVLQACMEHDLIPILELHDQTCTNDYAALITLADWYLQDDVYTIIKRYEHSMILNLFNEALHINWTGDIVTGEANFIQTYTTIIEKLRNGGIEAPFMIDGSECGTNLWSLAAMAPTLVAADPMENIIFSAHSYWFEYAETPSEMDSLINFAASQNVPLVIGELANLQDINNPCDFELNYQYLATICMANDIGWMAWAWDNDACAMRQMTTDGQFTNLTAFGDAIVNDATFGLATNPPMRNSYLLNDGCLPTAIADVVLDEDITLYPNPVSSEFTIVGMLGDYDLDILDSSGSTVYSNLNTSTQSLTINISSLPSGLFFVRIRSQSMQSQPLFLQTILKQ